MTEHLVIFGASGGGVRVARTLVSLNTDFLYFVDNDKNKWGMNLEGKIIYSPERLLTEEDNLRIIIASEYQKEIEEQLTHLGLDGKRVEKEIYIKKFVQDHLTEFDYLRKENLFIHSNKKIFIDLLEGIKLGGIETWSLIVARGLLEQCVDVELLISDTDELPPEDLVNIIVNTKASYTDYWGTIKRLVNIMINHLPCTIIINKQTQALYAAYIVKQFFPDQIRLISVIHNDLISYYRRQNALIDYVDAVACVSLKIKERFINEFHLPKEKIFYKESSVDFEPKLEKKYTFDRTKPLCLGFAARIAKAQKRADLIIPLIKGLEEKDINYELSIAGNGPFYSKISEFIEINHLHNKVHILGQIERHRIKNFWSKQDVFISLSEYEGSSLSLLEAMSFGVVPVVTKVSGATEFVGDGINGFLCDVGNIDQMTSKIQFLEQKRELLQEFGLLSRKIIEDRCKKEDYMKYIIKLAEYR